MSIVPTPADLIDYPKLGGGWGNIGSDLRSISKVPQLRWDPKAAAKFAAPHVRWGSKAVARMANLYKGSTRP